MNRENARVTLREGVERDVVFDLQRRQLLSLNSPLGREHLLQPQFRNSPTWRQLTSLTKTAVDLLLQAMETRAGKVQVATLRQVAPRAADKLLEARLLVATGRIPVVAAMDGYEDEPIPAEWCPERGQYGYRDSVGRWITVEAGEIAACTVD